MHCTLSIKMYCKLKVEKIICTGLKKKRFLPMYCSQNHDIFVVVLSTAILLAKSCPDSQSDDLQKTKMKMSLVHQVKPARSEVSIVSPLASRQRIHPGSAFAWKQGKNKQGRTGDWCLCCGSDSWPALHYPPAD